MKQKKIIMSNYALLWDSIRRVFPDGSSQHPRPPAGQRLEAMRDGLRQASKAIGYRSVTGDGLHFHCCHLDRPEGVERS